MDFERTSRGLHFALRFLRTHKVPTKVWIPLYVFGSKTLEANGYCFAFVKQVHYYIFTYEDRSYPSR